MYLHIPSKNYLPQKLIFFFCFLIYFFINSSSSIAQKYIKNVQYYGIKEELPKKEIYGIYFDQRDSLWIGTAGGLYRYDGQKFSYCCENNTSLLKKDLQSTLVDSRHGTPSKWEKMPPPFYSNPYPSIGKTYYRPQDQSIWYTDQENFFVFHLDERRIYNLSTEYPQFTQNEINHIYFARDSLVWVSTSKGLYAISIAPSTKIPNWFGLVVFCLLIGALIYGYKWRTYQLKKRQRQLEKLIQKRTHLVKKQNIQLRKDQATIEIQADKLRKLDKLKSQFFANISHEIRTPLTLILGPLNAILQRQKVDNHDFTMLTLMKQNAQSLLSLINGILDLSKLEANKMKLEEEICTLYPLLRRILSQYESHAQKREIQLHFDFQLDKNCQILLDVEKFERIVNNLLSNAIKFTLKGGKVFLSIYDKGNELCVCVKDTGIGIHSEDLPHIFDRFYQSERKTPNSQPSTGIGLALCNEYVQLFQGKLLVESALGVGSTFTFQFSKREVFCSLMQENEILCAQASTNKLSDNLSLSIPALPEPSPSSAHAKILIVEDNFDLRKFLSIIFSHQYEVDFAWNGQEAIEKLTNNNYSPDIIISDVMMPIMDGYQFLEKLNAEENWKNIPVIMLSARDDLTDRLKGLRLGIDDYISKPFVEEELIARIENILKRQREKSKWIQKEEPEVIISPELSFEDSKWLDTVAQTVNTHLGDHHFNTQLLAETVSISRTQLFRKIKKLTGLTPSQYIQEARLSKARDFLEKRTYNSVKAVAYSVGLKHLGNFAGQFKTRFGRLPSEYLN